MTVPGRQLVWQTAVGPLLDAEAEWARRGSEAACLGRRSLRPDDGHRLGEPHARLARVRGRRRERAPVTVIVPVYNALEETRRCIASVFRHADATGESTVELLVIDDASPDPADRPRFLDGLRSPTGSDRAHRAPQQGEPRLRRDVQPGHAARSQGDVVILNSDTVVTAGWLDRLHEAAQRPDVATVTPLTNFGSICTRAAAGRSTPSSSTASDRGSTSAPTSSRGRSVHRLPEVITGVGFCMYMHARRARRASACSTRRRSARATARRSTSACGRRRSGSATSSRTPRSCSTRAAGRSASGRQEGLRRGRQLLHARYRFFRADERGRASRRPAAVSFAALELGLDERRDEPTPRAARAAQPPGRARRHREALLAPDATRWAASSTSRSCSRSSDGFLLHDAMWTSGRGEPLRAGVPAARRPRPGHDRSTSRAPPRRWRPRSTCSTSTRCTSRTSSTTRSRRSPCWPTSTARCRARSATCTSPAPTTGCSTATSAPAASPRTSRSARAACPRPAASTVDHLERVPSTVAERLDTVDHWVFASQSAADYFLRVYDVDRSRIEIIEHGAIIEHDRRASASSTSSLIFDEPLRSRSSASGGRRRGSRR